MDPSSAALIAAQLCHSVQMADQVYALTRRRNLGAQAVHMAQQAIRCHAEDARQNKSLAVDLGFRIDSPRPDNLE